MVHRTKRITNRTKITKTKMENKEAIILSKVIVGIAICDTYRNNNRSSYIPTNYICRYPSICYLYAT